MAKRAPTSAYRQFLEIADEMGTSVADQLLNDIPLIVLQMQPDLEAILHRTFACIWESTEKDLQQIGYDKDMVDAFLDHATNSCAHRFASLLQQPIDVAPVRTDNRIGARVPH